MSACEHLTRQRPFRHRLWLLAVLAMVAVMLSLASSADAAGITVTTTADEFGTGAGCSLREAVQAANTNAAFGGCPAGSGADTISVPAGTYVLTLTGIEDANTAGDLDVTSSMTLDGVGAGSTIIDGNSTDRVFDVFPASPVTFGLSDVTVRNGHTPTTGFNVGGAVYLHNNVTATVSDSTFSGNVATTTGGALESRGVLTVSDSTFSNNTSGALGGAINASSTTATLTVTGSTFTGNQAEAGGALNISTNAGNNSSITTSSFQNNQTVLVAGGVAENGGAIRIDTDGDVGITKSTFTGNTAVADGGAVYFNDNATQAAVPTLSAAYNRIVGNTAVTGDGLFRASGTATAEKNWWGCNGGPAAGPCDVVSGTVDFTPWIVLSHTASPGSVSAGQQATLTADVLKNSDASANVAGDLTAFTGVAITFSNAILGTLSNAQTTIQSSGAATATYTAGSTSGPGSADATVDAQTVTASVTVTRPGTTVTSINRSGSNPTNAASVGWTVVFASAVSGLTSSNFTLVNGGLGGSPGISNVAPVGSAPATSWTVTASTGSGTGTLGLDLTNDTGLDHAVTNLPLTGQEYTVDNAAPDVTINQSSGQADPTSAGAIHFTVVFTEQVSGFIGSDVSLSGTAAATTAVVTEVAPNDGTTYDVAVSGMTTGGTVIASIAANRASDAAGNGNTASTSTDNTVTFIGNSPPTANNDTYSTNEDTALTVAAPGVLGNDSDPDAGDTLTAVLVSGPTHAASFTLDANGSFSYTPAPNYNGPDSFTYNANDGTANSNVSATVSITVNAVNDPPTAAVTTGGTCSASGAGGTMNLTLADADSPLNSLTLNGNSSNTNLVPNANIVFGGSGASRTVSITAVAQKSSQTASVTITVGDGQTSSTVTIRVTVGTDNNEALNGTSGADMMFGLNGANTINGNAGNDLLCGGNGADTISGGDGNDTLEGASGNDLLDGGTGNDILRGAAGNDRLTGGGNADSFSGGKGTDTSTDFNAAQGDSQDGTIP